MEVDKCGEGRETKMLYVLSRQEISKKASSEYVEGDCVKVGKYLIWIKYGQYSRPSLLSSVSTLDNLRDMSMWKQPEYIRSFIDCMNENK